MRFALWLYILCLVGAFTGCRRSSGGAIAPDANVVVARLLVQPGNTAATGSQSKGLEDFYDAQVSLLDGDELKRAAISKAMAGKTVASAPPLGVQVARIRGKPIVTISVRCESQEYAKAYLDALITEYVTKVQGVITNEDEQKKQAQTGPDQLAGAENALREAEKSVARFKLDHDTQRFESEIANARKRVKKLVSAESFYQSELDLMSKTGLDSDLMRRRNAVNVPADMPEEFSRLINGNLTPNEQAYLDALTKTDLGTIKATRTLAEQDQKTRLESFRHQLDTVRELARDQEKRITETVAAANELQKLEKNLSVTRDVYQKIKQTQTKAETEVVTSLASGVVVTIIEKPAAIAPPK